jgi:hypothetical protein
MTTVGYAVTTRSLPPDAWWVRADDWRDSPAGTVTAMLASWITETVAAEKEQARTYRWRSGGGGQDRPTRRMP